MAVAYAVIGPALLGGSRADKRLQTISKGGKAAKGKGVKDDSQQRRRAVQETLKQLEKKQQERKKKRNIGSLIEQSGRTISMRAYWLSSLFVAGMVALLVAMSGVGWIAVVLAAFIGFIGLPRWVLSFLCKRRQKAFTLEFANALDIIVRGVKSGLPLNECLKIIARESPEPVGSEFVKLVDAQKVGVPLDQGLGQLYERMPVAEVNFFQIVLIIQQAAGGNLSEALGNLSGVLRNRKAMRAKIQAMSSEAKASALIIGSLPPGVMGLVYLTSPDYITLLFSTQLGNMMLIGSGLWMLCGVFVMRKMINFNF
jgi:tight adherence protein B